MMGPDTLTCVFIESGHSLNNVLASGTYVYVIDTRLIVSTVPLGIAKVACSGS